jgi:CubicO group peptidase (beta-lactamase class C family)
MKNVFPFLLFFVVAACRHLPQTGGPFAPDIAASIAQVEQNVGQPGQPGQTLEERMKSYHLNGLSIAVIRDYKIEWVKGYGWADKETDRPVTPQTLFQAASISKSLNAVGLLLLAQDGKLDLYTDINHYLSSWQFPYDSLSKGKKITVANLLSHTAGLSIHGFPGYAAGDSLPTVPEILDGKRPANTGAVRSMFEPGLKSEYSGGGTTITQLIVMDITHQPYDRYMNDSVLQPLGMSGSFYTQPPPSDRTAMLATAYQADGKPIPGRYHVYPEEAPAGLWTNPTDLSKYIIETQLSYQGKSAKVLSRQYTRLRLTPYIDPQAALGVFIQDEDSVRYFGHGGGNEGFRCQYYGSMEGGYGVVVMINSDSGGILQEVINSVARVYGWRGL